MGITNGAVHLYLEGMLGRGLGRHLEYTTLGSADAIQWEGLTLIARAFLVITSSETCVSARQGWTQSMIFRLLNRFTQFCIGSSRKGNRHSS